VAVEEMRGLRMTLNGGIFGQAVLRSGPDGVRRLLPGGTMGLQEERKLLAIACLRRHGDAAVRALAAALTDPDPGMRQDAALVLGWFANGMLPEAQPKLDVRAALPALVKATRDPDVDVRAWSVGVLSDMGPDAAPALPALIQSLSDPGEGSRLGSCSALGQIREGVTAALPALRLAAQKDPSENVRRCVTHVISVIEAGAAGRQ
jgi:HEAT repeat protein